MKHSEDIRNISFSPDGKYIASCSDDQTVKIWDIKTAKLIRTLIGHEDDVKSVSFSPDGKTIVSGSLDKTIKLWDMRTGKEIKTLKGHQTGIRSISFSPDGKSIISAEHEIFKKWDVQTGKEMMSIRGHKGSIFCILYSPDCKTIATGGEDKTVKIWDSESGSLIKSIKAGSSWVRSISYSPDGKTIASAGVKTIELWDSQTGNKIQTLRGGHLDAVTSLSFSPNGKFIVSGSQNGLALWDSQTGKLILSKTVSEEKLSFKMGTIKLSFSPDGNNIVSGYKEEIKIWNSKNGDLIRSFGYDPYYSKSANFSSDLKRIITKDLKDNIRLWNSETGTEIQLSEEYNDSVCNISFSPDNKLIAIGINCSVKILDSETGRLITNIKGYNNNDFNLTFSPDSKYLAMTYRAETNIYNIQTGGLNNNIVYYTFKSFNPDNEIIELSEGYSMNIETSKITRTYKNYEGICSPDGKIRASWNNAYDIVLNGTQYLSGHKDRILHVTFSPDSKIIASGSADNTVKLWDSQKGNLIRTLKGHTDGVNDVFFNPQGNIIISKSIDNVVKIWKTDTGELLLTLYLLKDFDEWVTVTPEGRFDATDAGIKYLNYIDGMEIIPLENIYEQFYTPNLFARVLGGEKFEKPEVDITNLKPIPLVEITSPENGAKQNSKEIAVAVKVTDQGGGIDEIRLYHNGKLVETTQRGFKPLENKEDAKTKTFTISLTEGKNLIKATAFNNQRTEAIPDEISLYYEGTKANSNLYVLAVGLNKYKNPKYNLNYAVADATAFKEAIEKGSQTIFDSVNITFLKDENATRLKIRQEFEKLKSIAKQEDVFILYYAGHGVMSQEKKSQFYIVPHDVTQLYGNNELLQTKAISEKELENFAEDLKAQKQLFIFDACQSGGMTDFLASRGAAEEKAIAQLARSTGTFWLTASNSEQFATEFTELGHGLFTYTILMGLQGKADGENKDKKITVQELSSFLNDKVPELSEKHKGEAQYPSIYGYGMDFPIVIVKE